jgi:hypothetical protein
VLKKKIWANFQRIIELFTQQIVKKLSKIWIWDPGSGKNLFRIPDPGSKRHRIPDPGSGSATLLFVKNSLAKVIFSPFSMLGSCYQNLDTPTKYGTVTITSGAPKAESRKLN